MTNLIANRSSKTKYAKVASLADELIDEEAYLSRIDRPWMQNH